MLSPATSSLFKMGSLDLEKFRHPPHRSLRDKRIELISGRCYFVLEKQNISRADVRSFVLAMVDWFWKQEVVPANPEGDPNFFPSYTRPISKTIWDERFDLSQSIANQPVTKEFLEFIGRKKQLPRHRFYGYVAALALIEIMQGLMGTNPEDLDAFKNFSGPYEEGGTDWTAIELDEETETMIENLLGKAEEFIFKADAFENAARKGSEGAPPKDYSWEPPIVEYLRKNPEVVEGFRKPSGKINRNGLAKHLVSELQAKRGIKLAGNDRTIVNRLIKLLREAGILEMRG